MSDLSNISPGILLAVYEGQRNESLQHRQSIVNVWGVAMAGLIALGAGGVALGTIPDPVQKGLTCAVLLICGLVYFYIRRRRSEAEKGLNILREIEKHWKVLDEDIDSSLLPPEWYHKAELVIGLTKGDQFHMGALFGLGIFIILLIWLSG